jgi:hypothetical protein
MIVVMECQDASHASYFPDRHCEFITYPRAAWSVLRKQHDGGGMGKESMMSWAREIAMKKVCVVCDAFKIRQI